MPCVRLLCARPGAGYSSPASAIPLARTKPMPISLPEVNVARLLSLLTVSFAVALPAARSGAADWPVFGRDWTRNAVSPERNPPLDWDSAAARNVKWSAALGSTTIGAPVVAGGLVWVTSNNEGHHDPSFNN